MEDGEEERGRWRDQKREREREARRDKRQTQRERERERDRWTSDDCGRALAALTCLDLTCSVPCSGLAAY